jgi:outer membrane biosynthesis protein TonB
MKTLQLLTTTFLLFAMSFTYAQEVTYNNETYKVDGKYILKNGEDVTESLSEEAFKEIIATAETIQQNERELAEEAEKMQAELKAEIKEEEKAQKEAEKRKKAQEKAEKEVKKAEKKQKKAEKALKKKEKVQKRFEKANDKLESAQKKYDKLKRKGKLSPDDEAKWLKKLEGLQRDIVKTKKKL